MVAGRRPRASQMFTFTRPSRKETSMKRRPLRSRIVDLRRVTGPGSVRSGRDQPGHDGSSYDQRQRHAGDRVDEGRAHAHLSVWNASY
jgi:hypothetical protein